MSTLNNVADTLRQHARMRPDQPALIVPDGQGWTSISYRALNTRVDRFARGGGASDGRKKLRGIGTHALTSLPDTGLRSSNQRPRAAAQESKTQTYDFT